MSLMGSTKKRRTYTPEYRREAAHLVIDTDRTIAAVAADLFQLKCRIFGV
jgi:transposase